MGAMHQGTYQAPPTLADGRYLVDKELGRGGVGVVVKARDEQLARTVAIKILYPQYAKGNGRQRFITEAETMRGLVHPNIVEVYEIGHDQGTSYFTMELMRRGNAHKLARRTRGVPVRWALALTIDLLSALEAAHAAGVIHRDVKPGNVLLTLQGVGKLGDFGILRTAQSKMTRTGTSLGTINFMAPEQRLDPRGVTPASDQYSVAATLYAISSGNKPPDLSCLDLEPALLEPVPGPLRPLVRRAGQYNPRRRFPSVVEMREEAARILEGLGGVLT